MTSSQIADTLPAQLPGNPMHIAAAWLEEATSRAVRRNPNAMTLATAGADGQLSARIVLCKAFVADPGYIVFYTNYQSRKARDLAHDSRVAVLFHWDALGRQVRLEGLAVRSPDHESDAYFATRDPGSQLGAWGSDQSRPIQSRDALIAQIRARAAELGISPGSARAPDASARPAVARPPHWGGFRIWASAIELWLEGKDRIHDRALWRRQLERADAYSYSGTPWTGTRLQP